MKLNKTELLEVVGGINITGTLINAITKGISTILDFGRSIGSSIRRIIGGKICPL